MKYSNIQQDDFFLVKEPKTKCSIRAKNPPKGQIHSSEAKELSRARSHSKRSIKQQSLDILLHPCVNPCLTPSKIFFLAEIFKLKPPEKDSGKLCAQYRNGLDQRAL